MKDSRCLGRDKMQYTHTALDGTKTTIHYVGCNKMVCCPFHDDKNPSMQVYLEKPYSFGRRNFMGLLGSLICVHFTSKQWVHIRRNIQLNI
jgi:hypothetical protein